MSDTPVVPSEVAMDAEQEARLLLVGQLTAARVYGEVAMREQLFAKLREAVTAYDVDTDFRWTIAERGRPADDFASERADAGANLRAALGAILDAKEGA